MFVALKYQFEIAVDCPKISKHCNVGDQVTIAVLLPHKPGPRTDKSIDSWIRIARGLGMRVLFFGPHDENLPSVSITAPDEITFTFKALDWLKYRYGSSSGWFFIAQERTFIHPYYMLKDVICIHDSNEAWYIGERGSTPSSGYESFAASGPGYLLSAPALEILVNAWNDRKCTPTVAEDVTIGKCMKKLGVPVSSNNGFISKYEHHYLKPLPRFYSLPVQNTEEMDEIIDRFFTPCNF